MQDGAAVTGLAIAAASLVAVNKTGNAIYDPIGSIVVGNLLGMVCYTPYSIVHADHLENNLNFFNNLVHQSYIFKHLHIPLWMDDYL